jgi:hypothetical protein
VAVYRAKRGYGDESYLTFAAFARLKTGRIDEARALMREHKGKIGWARNEDHLHEAAMKGDTAFEFDPGPFPPLDTAVLRIR